MEFYRRADVRPSRLGIVPGTFNPPTRAHTELAAAALTQVDEVLFVIPRRLPHKTYEGVGFTDRLRLLEIATSGCSRYSLAATDRGLFVEIARECRAAYGPGVNLAIVCGRDAAERAVHWEYGSVGAFTEQLQEFELLVASRKGAFAIPEHLRERVHRLEVPSEYDAISATDVRERIRLGQPWEHLVPDEIVSLVRESYGA